MHDLSLIELAICAAAVVAVVTWGLWLQARENVR